MIKKSRAVASRGEGDPPIIANFSSVEGESREVFESDAENEGIFSERNRVATSSVFCGKLPLFQLFSAFFPLFRFFSAFLYKKVSFFIENFGAEETR